MAEPFKNLFNKDLILDMARHFVNVWPEFDQNGFTVFAIDGLDSLELKARSNRITDSLERFLPDDFPAAAKILIASLDPASDLSIRETNSVVNADGIRGWAVMPMADYIARRGQDHLDLSLNALKEMTMRFSSEMAIRPFIKNHEKTVLNTLAQWAGDPNYHVRRLVSEGTRPRLPWAMQLPQFIKDPSPILLLLEVLKDDEEEYVRRSVANNLNDIAKDHANLVARIAGRWLIGASKDRKKLVRHACRTLIKQGHKGTLEALGYRPPDVKLNRLKILTPQVSFGEALTFELSVTSASGHAQPLILDYAIHHRKANGGTSPKVFKWKTTTLKPRSTLTAQRRHAIRKITTRVYYPGTHRLEILANGVSLGCEEFELLM
jgi:3-methyladenine DNA glycosylase AlkC